MPNETNFAFVRFKSVADAEKCSLGLDSVGGAPAAAQPAKHAHADVAAWRSRLARGA